MTTFVVTHKNVDYACRAEDFKTAKACYAANNIPVDKVMDVNSEMELLRIENSDRELVHLTP